MGYGYICNQSRVLWQATICVTVEIEGNDRSACVIDTISRYYSL